MGSRYLTDLAQVCRAAGLQVVEEPGWETRSRGSGGYDSGRPTHVMIHHTASNPSSDGQPDVDYCCYNAADRPLANLYLSRTGTVWVMAAGATNTNGSGGPLDNVPADQMNTHAVGIEAANTGTGESWTPVQQDAYLALCDALCTAYGVQVPHVREHAEWAPQRKIDPAGPSAWATSGTWSGPAFRSDLDPSHPPPLPPLEDLPVDYLEVYRDSTQYSLFARSGVVVVNITNAQRTADKGTRNPDPPTVKCYDAAALGAYVLLGDAPVWYDGSAWPPVSAFGGHLK